MMPNPSHISNRPKATSPAVYEAGNGAGLALPLEIRRRVPEAIANRPLAKPFWLRGRAAEKVGNAALA
jgi:hypothetical protein